MFLKPTSISPYTEVLGSLDLIGCLGRCAVMARPPISLPTGSPADSAELNTQYYHHHQHPLSVLLLPFTNTQLIHTHNIIITNLTTRRTSIHQRNSHIIVAPTFPPSSFNMSTTSSVCPSSWSRVLKLSLLFFLVVLLSSSALFVSADGGSGDMLLLSLEWANRTSCGSTLSLPSTFSGLNVNLNIPLTCLSGPSASVPMVSLMASDPTTQRVFTMWSTPSTAAVSTQCTLLVSLPSSGAVFNTLSVPVGHEVKVLEYDPALGYLYMLTFAVSGGSWALYTLDPTGTTWTTALINAQPVSGLTSTTYVQEGVSAYLSSIGVLFFSTFTLSSNGSMATSSLMGLNVQTTTLSSYALSDPSMLTAGESWEMVALSPSSLLLMSPSSSAVLSQVSTSTHSASVSDVNSVSSHVSTAVATLGCGGLYLQHWTTAADVGGSSTTNSSTMAWAAYYAVPSLLSQVNGPFAYLLHIDTVNDAVVYSAVDRAPDQIISTISTPTISDMEPTSVTSTAIQGGQLTLTVVGTGLSSAALNMSCHLSSSAILSASGIQVDFPVIVVNDTVGMCTIRGPLSSWLQAGVNVTVSIWGRFPLYTGLVGLPSAFAHASVVNVTVSSGQVSAIRRSLSAYYASYNLVDSATASQPAVAGNSPLAQAHATLTRGLTYVTQVATNISAQLSAQGKDVSQVNLAAIAASVAGQISTASSVSALGVQDVFNVFSSGATTVSAIADASNDLVYAANLASISLPLDGTALPALFSQLDGQINFALDTAATQAQSWLSGNLQVALDAAGDIPLSLGAVLPAASNNVVQQLSSITINTVLQQAENLPVLQHLLNDPGVQTALGLVNDVSDAINNPLPFVQNLLGQSSVGRTINTIINDGEDIASALQTVSLPFSDLTTAATSLTNSLLNDVGSFADTVDSLGTSLMTDLSKSFSTANGAISLVGGVASFVIGDIFHDPQAASIVSGVASVAGVAAMAISGLATGGIAPAAMLLASGLSSLFSGIFGGGSSGDAQQLQQIQSTMVQGFNQINGELYNISLEIGQVGQLIQNLSVEVFTGFQDLSSQMNTGFSELENVTIQVGQSLSQQMLYENYQVMNGLVSIINQLNTQSWTEQSISNQIAAVQQTINNLYTLVTLSAQQTEQNTVTSFYNTLQGILADSQQQQSRSVLNTDLSSYSSAMSGICSHAVTWAQAVAMSGDISLSRPGYQIRQSLHYDTNIAYIVPIMQALKVSMPTVQGGSGSMWSTNLANPLAWARSANIWMEARVAVIASPAADSTCLPSLWAEGQRLQLAVKQAVSKAALMAQYSALQSVASLALSQLATDALASIQATQNTTTGGSPFYQFPFSTQVAAIITGTANTVPWSNFDDQAAEAAFLLSLGQAVGLGQNGYTTGYVANLVSPGTSSTAASDGFVVGQKSTAINWFSPVTSTQDPSTPTNFKLALQSLVTLQRFQATLPTNIVNASQVPPITASQIAQFVVSQGQLIFNTTLNSYLNAINLFYPPCSTVSLPTSGLPIVDATMRRLAAVMMQLRVQFSYAGRSVLLPSPSTVAPPLLPPSTFSSSSARAGSSATSVSVVATSPSVPASAPSSYPSSSSAATPPSSPTSATGPKSAVSSDSVAPSTASPSSTPPPTLDSTAGVSTGSSPSSTPASSSSNSDTEIIAIAAGAAGGAIALVILVAVICCCCFMKQGQGSTAREKRMRPVATSRHDNEVDASEVEMA